MTRSRVADLQAQIVELRRLNGLLEAELVRVKELITRESKLSEREQVKLRMLEHMYAILMNVHDMDSVRRILQDGKWMPVQDETGAWVERPADASK
jgi:hypothetical protein